MKKAILFLLFFAALASVAVGQNETDWFKTRWIAPANGTIRFPATGSGYTIRYVPINHITGAPIGAMQTISPASSGQVISGLTAGWTYRIDAYGGTFNRVNFGSFYNNKQDIVRLEQWGTTQWATMNQAFYGCENMDVTATDVPDLSACQDVSLMFFFCKSLVNGNGSISGWQTANITNMQGMFQGATAFNQPLNNWNTQSVTNMDATFNGATAFNQPLSNWNTQSVTTMNYMFSRATAFNQPLNWNTANVTNMGYVFQGATSFNQPLNWNTANVTTMVGMFSGATSFNQPLNWNTANVTNMGYMFYGATSFNQPLTNFNTQNVTDMGYMFFRATAFNQPLTNFNTQNVISMRGMFYQATAFNGDVNSWGNKVKNVTTIEDMFNGATSFNHSLEDWVLKAGVNTGSAFAGTSIDCHNLTVTLEGWAKNSEYVFFDDYEARESYFSPILSISFPSQYGYKAKHLAEYLMAYKRISVYLSNQRYIPDCNGTEEATGYILEIDSRRNATGAATPTNRQVNINVVGTNFSAKYTEIGNPSNTGTVTGLNTGSAITLPSPGKYTIAVYAPDGGSITALSTTTAPLSNGYITNIAQWGTTKWQSLKDAFKGCSGLTRLSAADQPNLSEITSLEAMFQNCTGLISVPNINKWNLSNVTSLKSMFAGTTAFNQSLQNLDVSHIADFSGMFSGATAFDRSLGYWNLSGITDGNTAMLNMFDNSGLSCLSYHATLSGWSIKPSTPSNIRLGAANINYSNAAAAIRTNLQTNKGWTFVGDQLSAGCGGADASGRYITVWDTRNSNSPLRIRPNIQATNVTIDWEEVGNPSNNGTTNSFYVDLPYAGVYRLKAAISNNTALIKASYTNTEIKTLLYVEQWGNTPWKYLTEAFSGAINLQVLATDVPNFSQMDQFGGIEGMFEGCTSLTSVPSITSWNLNYLGQYRKSLSRFFLNCKNFDQDLNAWDVSSIKDMSRIFEGCTSFNHPLNNWNVSNVTSMNRMFLGTPFNQDITGWDVSNVTNMGEMFADNTSFNQPIGLWGSKMANVTWAIGMFSGATSFNQDLGAWKLTNIYYFENVFTNSGMSCENYSASLVGWASQPESWHAVRRGSYGSSKSLLKYNAAARAARNLLISKGWMDELEYYVPDCQDNFYETTWEVGHNINPNADTLTINAIGTNFTVLWEAIDSTQNPPAREVGMDAAANASPGHPYTLMQNQWSKARVPGKVKVKVLPGEGTLTGLNMRGVDPGKLVSVDHWGNNKWQRLDSAFIGCERMELKATDVPDLSEVTGNDGLKYMFWGCMAMTDLHDKIGTWDVSTIKNTAGMFGMASAFNRNIGSWDVSNVTDMSSMFARTTAFNQPIGSWNVGAVTNMSSMFDGATAFNKPLNDWNVSKVTSMHTMFNGATAFNQPLDRWDVRKSTSMGAMFYGATAFDQPLGKWKPFTSTMMGEMFGYSGMSCENYSSTLYGWTQNVDSLKPNVYMTLQHNMKYNRRGKYARNKLTTAKNWTFGQDTEDLTCGLGMAFPTDYVSEWDLSQPAYNTRPDAATTLKTNLWGTNFVVEWLNLNDNTTGVAVATTTTEPYTITGLTAGKRYRVVAYADPSNPSSTLSKLSSFSRCDVKRLDSVTQWGNNRWTSLRDAFRNCTRMDVTATDVPNLNGVSHFAYMFMNCTSLVYNPTINTWRIDSIILLLHVFRGAKAFNQPLDNWNTENVTRMDGLFYGAEAFNQPIGGWNVEKVSRMDNMFHNAEAFDQDLSGWTLKNVTDAIDMFSAPLNKGMSCKNYSKTLQGWANNPLTYKGLNFPGQDNRKYNIIGKEARDILTKPIANGGKGWTISGDSEDTYCGIDYVWTGAISTDITNVGNWQGGRVPASSPTLGEFKETVAFDSLAVRDMHIPSLPYTPPGSDPNVISFYSFGNFINKSNKKLVIEPNGHLYIGGLVLGSDSASKVDKIVVKADNTRPNGSLILAGQPCDKPVYATVEMYSKAGREATAMTWTDNIPSSPTKDSLFSVHYRWQYIGIPVEGEVANAFYGSYLRKYDETYNDPNHYYGKWRKLGADETWQPLVPFAGYEVTSRTPKVYVFKGRLLHCPQELTLTRQAAEVSAVPSSFTDPRERRWELGHNVFGNSYTSALNISNGKFFVDLEARYPIGQEPIEGTVYVYNTGSIADWAGGGTLGSGPGQYTAVPMHNATLLSEQYISSMQGFMLKFKEDTIRINGVGSPVKFRIGLTAPDFTGVYPFGGNQRPQRAPQADPIHGYLKVGLTSRRSVSSISLVEAEGTTDEFDNGWDGMQLNTGRSSSATLFVPSEYGDLQVSTSDNIVGDRFGIFNNGDTTYRLTVIRHRLDNHGELYLYDVATNRYTLLDTDTTVYDFTSEGSGNVDKRFVITDRRNADDPNTAVEEAAEDMSLYGYVDGRHTLIVNNHTAEAGTLTLLDVSGKAVYTSPFGVGFSRHDLSHLPAGVYIARLEASTRRATVKAITMK